MTKHVHLYLPLRSTRDAKSAVRRNKDSEFQNGNVLLDLIRHHARGETTEERMVSLLEKWDVTPDEKRRLMATFKRERSKKGSVDAGPGRINVKTMSSTQLIKLWQDPSADERDAGAALAELARRGFDPRTGKSIGVEAATRIARQVGEMAPS